MAGTRFATLLSRAGSARRQPDGSLTVEPHRIQDSSMLSVLSWCNALMIRPPHDPARKAGESVQIIDLSVLPGGY